jgi:RND family efflux transporter MFP subunit
MTRHRACTVLLLLAAGLAGLAGCNRGQREPWPEDNNTAGQDLSGVVVTVEPVAFRQVERTVEAVGTLYGYEEVSISAKVEGRVRKILHDVADRVKPAELLLETDPTDYDLAVRQAEQAVRVELARLGLEKPPGPAFDVSKLPPVVQARLHMENAADRLQREQRLAAERAVAAEELGSRRTEFRVAQSEYENQLLMAKAGLATVRLKQEALAAAQQQLKDTLVRAPVPTAPVPGAAGGVTYVVTSRAVAEGSFVRPGTELFRLAIDRVLRLRAPVPERYLSEIRVGQKAEVSTAAYAYPFDGKVTRINPAVDPVSRTFQVEILTPNDRGELRPGSFAKAAIFTRTDPSAATVPLEALVAFAGVTKIFLAENGHAREVPVTLGVQGTKWVEVTRPSLARGAQVVTSGHTALADGLPVTVRHTSKQSGSPGVEESGSRRQSVGGP